MTAQETSERDAILDELECYASLMVRGQLTSPRKIGAIIRKRIATLRAATRAVGDAPAWIDISTAPKDGTLCDVWSVYTDAYGSEGQRNVNARFNVKKQIWEDMWSNALQWHELDDDDDMRPRGRAVTHWQPLPAPPATPRPDCGAESNAPENGGSK